MQSQLTAPGMVAQSSLNAADTAWLTVNSGRADVIEITVSATVDSLPGDDLDQLVSIA